MIAGLVWTFIVGVITQFWMWIVGAAVALLGLMLSPTLRKYTISAIAILAIGIAVWLWGYNSNHNVEIVTHTCDAFRNLLRGPSTEIDKIISLFNRKGLCV